jgi:hypothetical protein
VDALVQTLAEAGHEVTLGPLEPLWDATNPPLDGFDVVVHLNGGTFHTPLPMASQVALTGFVRAGGAYVGNQYNGFEAATGWLDGMADLVLQLWPHPDNCNECFMTWTTVPGQEAHPVLEAVPTSFAFFADGHDAGSLVEFAEDPSTVLMTSPAGGPAVIVRELGDQGGRVVSFSAATNISTHETLQDPHILRLYANAVGREIASPASTIEDLQATVDELAESGVLNRIQERILDAFLRWADRFVNRGRTRAAALVLEGFARQIEWWVRIGEIGAEDGGPLVEDARAIIAGLGG